MGVPAFDPAVPGSRDVHAAVGAQVTVDAGNKNDPALVDELNEMIAVSDAVPNISKPGPEVELVAKGIQGGLQRGYAHQGGGVLLSDRTGETTSVHALRLAAGNGAEITFTVVPQGSELRIGVDRDEDGARDRDELDACSDPMDAASLPGSDIAPVTSLRVVRFGAGFRLSWEAVGASWDVVRGDLDALRGGAGDYSVAVDDCIGDDLSAPSLDVPDSGLPPSTFFLVRAACAGGTTYDSGSAGQVGARDGEIGMSAAACGG